MSSAPFEEAGAELGIYAKREPFFGGSSKHKTIEKTGAVLGIDCAKRQPFFGVPVPCKHRRTMTDSAAETVEASTEITDAGDLTAETVEAGTEITDADLTAETVEAGAGITDADRAAIMQMFPPGTLPSEPVLSESEIQHLLSMYTAPEEKQKVIWPGVSLHIWTIGTGSS